MTPAVSTSAHPSQAAIAYAEAEAGGVPFILLRYQVEAIELSHTTEFLSIEKSRRTGISYAFAADAVLTAAPAQGAQNVFYIAYNMEMTREFITYCGDFAKAFDEVATAASEFLHDDGSDKGIKAFRIDFPSGKSIVALSSKPRSLRGMQGVVIIDEAAWVRTEESFRDVYGDGYERKTPAAPPAIGADRKPVAAPLQPDADPAPSGEPQPDGKVVPLRQPVASFAELIRQRDMIDDAVDVLLEAEGWEALTPIVAPIADAIAKSASAEDLDENLIRSLAQSDVDRITTAIARAGFAVRVAGETGADAS